MEAKPKRKILTRNTVARAPFPEERSRVRSVRDRFMNCFVALLLAMTAEKTFSAAC
jgi:hypothetical protein